MLKLENIMYKETNLPSVQIVTQIMPFRLWVLCTDLHVYMGQLDSLLISVSWAFDCVEQSSLFRKITCIHEHDGGLAKISAR